jgi:hypothetical protein
MHGVHDPKQWRQLVLCLSNLPAHAGTQFDTEKGTHRGFKLSFVAWHTDADANRNYNYNYSSEHRNRRLPVPGRQEARDFIPNGLLVGLSRRANNPARFYRSSYQQLQSNSGRRGGGVLLFLAINNPPQLLGHHGHPAASAAIPRAIAVTCPQRRGDARPTDANDATAAATIVIQQSTPDTRPISQLSTITRSSTALLLRPTATTRRSLAAVTDTNASANSREYK